MRTKEEIEVDLKAVKEELRGIWRQHETLTLKRNEIERELAELIAPFKVGQRVIQKMYGKETEYEITGVKLWCGDEVEYYARKILKSGDLHKNVSRFIGGLSAKQEENHD